MKKIEAEILPISAMSDTDRQDFMQWVWETQQNLFDPDVIGYPRTIMSRAKNEDGNLLFIPIQFVLMYDSIAHKPDLTHRQEALCLLKIGEQVDEAARLLGINELYFFCADDRVADACAKHGFEELKGVRVLRRKLKTAENSLSDSSVGSKDSNEG